MNDGASALLTALRRRLDVIAADPDSHHAESARASSSTSSTGLGTRLDPLTFSLRVAQSRVDHASAGCGVFLSGRCVCSTRPRVGGGEGGERSVCFH